MKPGESLSAEQQKEAQSAANSVQGNDVVGETEQEQAEAIMLLLSGNHGKEVLDGPDYRQLGYDNALGNAA